ncbi:MAG: class I SAM-dependent methyltransferase, partial [Gemmatimonadetes bacterium]|nr:class I SAM-dependent methyltransferase [Gemmatimonadota bacterium]
VLEIGCGRGDGAAHIAREYGARVHAVDLDPDQIALARRLHGGCERLVFSVADASDLDLPDGSVDLIVCQHVFHHLPDWRGAVAEIRRVLRPGGHVVWLDLVMPAWLCGVFRPFADSMGVFTFGEVAGAFSGAGLEPCAHRSFHVVGLPHHDMLLRRP